MSLPVKLADVVEHLSLVSDETAVYLNKQTGEFVVLPSDDNLGFEDEDDFGEAESGEDPDWLEELDEEFKEEWKLRREILNSSDYIQLPDKFDINEWQIMDDFCRSRKNDRVRDQLLGLIRGKGAFGRFHSAIRNFGIENDWYGFRDAALSEIALQWLDQNQIEFVPIANSAVANARIETDATRSKSARDKLKSGPGVNLPQTSKDTTPVAAEDSEKGSAEEIKVFISNRDSHCSECDQDLGRKAWITLEREKGALCLACADLDELVFLSAGDAALTRRSKKYSTLSAVVLKFSKSRGRYERQGILVEEAALERAEAECLADSEVRERRNERARERRAELDEGYVKDLAKHIRMLFPNCPAGREQIIAQHACLKYSERVGRSAASKRFEDEMITLAVAAHVRHCETNYDALLAKGWFRNQARSKVRDQVEVVLEKWRGQ
jgi:hypothetical protein